MEDQTIAIGIKEIKELEFFVDEFISLGTQFDFNYNVDISHDLKNEMIRFVITSNYSNNETKELFMKGKVVTVFAVKDLKTFSRKNDQGITGIDLPDQVWITMFSIAFTHARAILSKSSAGTKFGHMLMPIINPEIEFKKLFGKFLKPISQE